MPTGAKTLIIANPKSRNGEGMACIQGVFNYINHAFHQGGNASLEAEREVELYLTKGPKDAIRRAAHTVGYDTVIALGGDGIIHEVVNGLMKIRSKKARPKLGIIPVGSGNDYAQTLCIPPNNPEASLHEALLGHTHMLDLGKVNGHYFVETMSCGLDAAIAQDTMQRRKKTNKRDLALYMESSLACFTKHHEGYEFKAILDDEREVSGTEVVFACQVGPTYGGGFKVCPDANPCDGLLRLCCSTKAPSIPYALILLSRAKFGKHTNSHLIHMDSFKKLHVSFEKEPPCQMDGEAFAAKELDVSVVPKGLEVIVGSDFDARYLNK